MKLGKKIVSMLMAVTTVATMVASAGAVGSYSGVSMTNGVARRTLFSDNPESIYSSNSTNGYLTGTTQAQQMFGVLPAVRVAYA